jgi:6-phosphogluconate dehydrogenase
MNSGVIGLGRMGANISRQALDRGHHVVGYDRADANRAAMATEGVESASSLEELAQKLERPRVVFLYVPHGAPTEEVCNALAATLSADDIVVDGGNSHWKDSARRHELFKAQSIRFLDMGTSGGVSGARRGACFMVGGPREAYAVIQPLLTDLAADALGVVHVSEAPGSGHFVKLVHNAIEFGMIQSIAEGVEMLMRSEYSLDLPSLFVNWNHGSVIRSWLVELMGQQLETYASEWDELSTVVEDTDEVKWVLSWAMEADIPSPVIALAQQALMQYRNVEWPAAKAHALLRNAFGEHPVHRIREVEPRR